MVLMLYMTGQLEREVEEYDVANEVVPHEPGLLGLKGEYLT